MRPSDKLPWIPFFPDAWLSGTRGFSAEQLGVYITLLALMYAQRGPIERDDAVLAKARGIGKKSFGSVLSFLLSKKKIIQEGATLTNPKATKELKNQQRRSSEARKKAGRRWIKKAEQKQGAADAGASAQHAVSICQTDATTSTLTEEKKEGATHPAKKAPARVLPDDWEPKPSTIHAIHSEHGCSNQEIDGMVREMRDWSLSKGQKRVDWDATLRNWARSPLRKPNGASNGTRRKTNADIAREAFDLIDRIEQSRSGEGSGDENRKLLPGR